VNKCADRWDSAFLTIGQAPVKDETCCGEGIPAPTAPESAEASVDGNAAGGAPLARIASSNKAVPGLHPLTGSGHLLIISGLISDLIENPLRMI
jgi:hypothetical protein